ncbi:MAG TPA: hypothetical protein VGN52_07005 [Burkholderiales bacterium]
MVSLARSAGPITITIPIPIPIPSTGQIAGIAIGIVALALVVIVLSLSRPNRDSDDKGNGQGSFVARMILVGAPAVFSYVEHDLYRTTHNLWRMVGSVLCGAVATVFAVGLFGLWWRGDDDDDDDSVEVDEPGSPCIGFERAHLRLVGDVVIPWIAITAIRIGVATTYSTGDGDPR